MRTALPLLAVLAISVSPASAGFEYAGFDETIGPGRVIERELVCSSGGTLRSGGYSLDNTDGPRARLVVVVNAPVSGTEWRVALMNDHDTTVHVGFRISILCD